MAAKKMDLNEFAASEFYNGRTEERELRVLRSDWSGIINTKRVKELTDDEVDMILNIFKEE